MAGDDGRLAWMKHESLEKSYGIRWNALHTDASGISVLFVRVNRGEGTAARLAVDVKNAFACAHVRLRWKPFTYTTWRVSHAPSSRKPKRSDANVIILLSYPYRLPTYIASQFLESSNFGRSGIIKRSEISYIRIVRSNERLYGV